MKVYVEFDGDWKAIPCTDRSKSVAWLVEEALKRGNKDFKKVNRLL